MNLLPTSADLAHWGFFLLLLGGALGAMLVFYWLLERVEDWRAHIRLEDVQREMRHHEDHARRDLNGASTSKTDVADLRQYRAGKR